MTAPLTILHAQVLTLDDSCPQPEAVLVGGGRVLAVGTREDLRAQAPHADVQDHRDLLPPPRPAQPPVHLAGDRPARVCQDGAGSMISHVCVLHKLQLQC